MLLVLFDPRPSAPFPREDSETKETHQAWLSSRWPNLPRRRRVRGATAGGADSRTAGKAAVRESPGGLGPGGGRGAPGPGPAGAFDRLTKRPNQLIGKRTKQGQVLLGTREEKKRKKGRFQVERKEGSPRRPLSTVWRDLSTTRSLRGERWGRKRSDEAAEEVLGSIGPRPRVVEERARSDPNRDRRGTPPAPHRQGTANARVTITSPRLLPPTRSSVVAPPHPPPASSPPPSAARRPPAGRIRSC